MSQSYARGPRGPSAPSVPVREPFEAEVADPLSEAPPEGWDSFADALDLSPLWRSRLLTTMAWCERYRPIMAVAREATGEVGALFWGRLVGVPDGPGRFHDPHRQPWIGFVEFYLPPGVSTAGYVFHPSLDIQARRQLLGVVERAVTARLGPRCRGFVYRQVCEGDLPTFRGRRGLILTAVPESVIDNEWDSFDGYLRSLPHDDRSELQRVRRIVDRDPTVDARMETSVVAHEASRLAHVVRMRYRTRFRIPGPCPSIFFERLSEMGGVRFITYRDTSGRLLAFGSVLDEGANFRSHMWGSRERVDGGRPNIYFDQILRQVDYCISEGRERLMLGKSMAKIKHRFGGRLVNLYTAVRPTLGTT